MSRSLGVAGPASQRQLLIPFLGTFFSHQGRVYICHFLTRFTLLPIDAHPTTYSSPYTNQITDLCNHASGSKHILTGRAAPGGLLKVTAGSDVVVGEEVAFAYGGGRLTSDRFLQDYGFLEGDEVCCLYLCIGKGGKRKRALVYCAAVRARLPFLSATQLTSIPFTQYTHSSHHTGGEPHVGPTGASFGPEGGPVQHRRAEGAGEQGRCVIVSEGGGGEGGVGWGVCKTDGEGGAGGA